MRRLVRSLRSALKRIYRRSVGVRPRDALRSWHGTAAPGEQALRVLHIGDCGARRMEFAHDLLGPPGYPMVLARELLNLGIALTFLHYFCVNFEMLPEIQALQSFVPFEAAPDIVLLQMGSAYTRRVVLPDTTRVHQLRDELGRRAGRFAVPLHRLLRPFANLVGRHSTPYCGPAAFERFLDAVSTAWPSAELVVVLPFRRSPGCRTGDSIGAQIDGDLRKLAAMPQVSVFDANPLLGRDPSLRCLTGYNLNDDGSELVGVEFARWLRAQRMLEDFSSS